jgi:carboxylate-amine ligase
VSPGRTLGVEEELQILDLDTWELAARAPQLLSRLPDEGFGAELQRSTIETNTAVCSSLGDLRSELLSLRKTLVTTAIGEHLGMAAVGTAPKSSASDFELTSLGRFNRMQQDYRMLVDEHLICGLQVHVGVPDRDLAVRLLPRLEPALPTLLALSASSPFWSGSDTGYASVRTMIWQRWPTAGATGQLRSAADYDQLVEDLMASGVISDARMAYFDVRPSSHAPTLELRVCDSCPLVDDAVLIAGLFRAIVEQAVQADARGDPLPRRGAPLHRAAMWRAARSGLADTLLGAGAQPVPQRAAQVVRDLVASLRPQLEAAGDWDAVSELSEATLARGSSSDRQRAAYSARGRITDVAQLVVVETMELEGVPAGPIRPTAGYSHAAADEALNSAGVPASAYQSVFEVLDRLGAQEVAQRAAQASDGARRAGLTFGVDGEQRVFPIDVIPRVIPAHEWALITEGLAQRARAIEAFLRDAYGPSHYHRDGLLPAGMVAGCPGWRDGAADLPPDAVRAPVIGFDLVRDGIAGWRVLEDNVRVPSGVGYAIAVRQLMVDYFPELAVGASIRSPDGVLALIGRTMRACSPRDDPVVALLSDGAANSAWYEHQLIAKGASFLLAQPGDMNVDGGGRVTVRGQRVDVVYLRLVDDLADLTDPSGRPVGYQLLLAAQRGVVVVVNSPGNGIADDKAMYRHIPDLIAYYLGEHPKLANVPTYRCADAEDRMSVLDRLGELVTKPVDGTGGGGVLIGREATPDELDCRRQEILARPSRWVGQETVALSTLPTLEDGRLEPRHVDLRAFVYLTGTEAGAAHVADLALTRVAPAGSMVVNSSRGGGAKDTWILTDPGGDD